jgi:hypothetical protein
MSAPKTKTISIEAKDVAYVLNYASESIKAILGDPELDRYGSCLLTAAVYVVLDDLVELNESTAEVEHNRRVLVDAKDRLDHLLVAARADRGEVSN